MKRRLLFLVSLLIHQTAPMGLTQVPSTISPGNRPVANIRSQILAVEKALRNQRYDEVVSRCNAILQLRPNNKIAAHVYWKRSMAYWHTNRPEAMSDAESAIHLDPTSPGGYVARAYINGSLGKHKLALADLNEAIRRDPRNSLAYANRGTVYYFLGDDDHALADYTEGIRRDAKASAGVFANRGRLYLEKHNYKAAFADLEGAVTRGKAESKTEYQIDLNSLAWNLATCPDDAYRNGRRAVELSKEACDLTRWESPKTIDTLAAAYAECGDFDQAIKYQTQAVSMVDHPESGLIEKEKTSALQERRERLVLYKNHKPCRDEHQRRKESP